MRITSVEVHEALHASATGKAQASVWFNGPCVTVQTLCAVQIDAAAPPVDIRAALVGDGLRQINRLPEYRSGAQSVSVAESVLEKALAQVF